MQGSINNSTPHGDVPVVNHSGVSFVSHSHTGVNFLEKAVTVYRDLPTPRKRPLKIIVTFATQNEKRHDSKCRCLKTRRVPSPMQFIPKRYIVALAD